MPSLLAEFSNLDVILLGCTFLFGMCCIFLFFRLRRISKSLIASEREARVNLEASQKFETQALQLNEELHGTKTNLALANQSISHLTEQHEADESRHNKQLEQLRTEFQNLANQIMEKNTARLEHHAEKGLRNLLDPLAEKIQRFETKVQSAYETESRERFALKGELERIILANQRISEDATNLTKALKGESKTQGNWGEMKLARVLEQSGLIEGEEFVREGKDLGIKSSTGSHLKPDVVVNLPDAKHIVVDSKVSLTSYERMCSALEEDRDAHAKEFLKSVKTHIDQLSEKHYQGAEQLNSPDFVLMFVPVEPAFAHIMQTNQDLLTYGWDKRIMIVTPTTLLAGLRTVASVWKAERQNKNAMEIARQGGALYDKFAAFVTDLEKIGKSLDDSKKTWSTALGKLSQGRGNLMNRAEKLRELGAKATKTISEETVSLSEDFSTPGLLFPDTSKPGASRD